MTNGQSSVDGPGEGCLDGPIDALGEFGLVGLIGSRFTQGPHVFVGPGDDAALVRTPQGHVVVSTDLQVEGRHFRRDWSEAHDIGRKAAATALADVVAMGGRNHSVTVGLAVPGQLPVRWALDLADGIATECGTAGASVVGGDLTSASTITIAVTVIGACEVAPVLRSGASPGDVVALCGRQGWAAAGLAVLGRGFRSPRVLVQAFAHPEPPYNAGPQAARAGATAMIDVSDGLLADLGHVAEASGVVIDVRTADLEVPEPFHVVAQALGVDPMRFVLGGGEDHSLVATFPSAASVPDGWRPIGEVRPRSAADADGLRVTVDGASYDGPRGWDHFGR